MISTLLKPDSGQAQIAGIDVVQEPARVRGSIGFLSTSTGLYERLTAREMIEYFARLQGRAAPGPDPRINRTLKFHRLCRSTMWAAVHRNEAESQYCPSDCS